MKLGTVPGAPDALGQKRFSVPNLLGKIFAILISSMSAAQRGRGSIAGAAAAWQANRPIKRGVTHRAYDTRMGAVLDKLKHMLAGKERRWVEYPVPWYILTGRSSMVR